ncbi:EAL domain-containing protein [Pseudomonas sp. RTC3]|uniref:EAL domain-containing response regulator n=1 Tax=unclassified Pseudomonas TaxID=196821 RepID=UPI002AB5792C|nr:MULTISPECIES: EAL domain-containing protein [unclassified Pseudomonas]MEB0061548.1 EAL domain-containing protein [Pseudomonas sp. RTC3]MDY7566677.1 EAL domain-containing protein [Pseudomonas sp. 5C2]MEB0025024.1 EAL domain-containing protein [Pseudomonas sp. MH9.2]MEB0150383.1 EAL domain-containing protein [Pseudomonas sp. CCC2.2]MEB0240650.1 EAL domain-containing protein [Pseudomonas sp. 5C2]
MISSSATVLIVDDDPQVRKLLELLLQHEGYRTRTAVSGEQALATIKYAQPDLILLDVMMPGMDGCQVASHLKANAETSSIPIIMLTALSDRSSRLAALEAGVEEFLSKPVDRAELWLRVRNLLRLKTFGDLLRKHSAKLEDQVQQRSADLQQFRAAMDVTADAITLIHRSTLRFVEFNASACDMLGYSREELLQMCPGELDGSSTADLQVLFDDIITGQNANELTETQLRCKNGSHVQVEIRRQAYRSGEEWIIVGVVRDITERKEADKRLLHMAHYDALTGLPNRTQFYATLQITLAQAADNGWQVAVLFIDLDHFKNVNETFGHAIGDELLRQLSNRLVQCVNIRDTVGRLGGDEFALILMTQDGQKGATSMVNKVREELRVPFHLKGHEVSVTASIGIALYPDDDAAPDTLIKFADTAMYRAKQAGRDSYRFFTAEMNTEVLARLDLETALRKAVENEEFVLHYQPKVRLSDGRVCGLEALLRWERPGHGLISPNAFIPALEETGMIIQVGKWIIATACQQIAQWQRSGIGPVQVSVNVSARQFNEGELWTDIIRALTDNHVAADLLELELTESSLMINTERTIVSLQKLRGLGIKVSIDDFGTGYSSLSYLRRFQIDTLKIDISFIREVTVNSEDAAIVLAIIHLAHSLKLDVIAEGVETVEQMDFLLRNHCDQIQGYLFSRPLGLHAIDQLLREDKRLTLLAPCKVRQPL